MMKQPKFILIIFLILALSIAAFLFYKESPINEEPLLADTTTDLFTEAMARVIAESTCVQDGETLSSGYYNENSKTWWFDATLSETPSGCNPACVVSEETRTAEINWRCTGLILPPAETAEQIRELFVEKYPAYADTVTVIITNETPNHARGSVDFVPGEAGGIFLATKVGEKWQLVFDGNGQISCDFAEYGFPEEMLTDCAE